MHRSFLDLLVCPGCRAPLEILAVAERDADSIVEGALVCRACEREIPIRNRIPRFVEEGYAQSFGWQWNRFHQLQRDSYNGTTMVRDTILRRSGWEPEFLADKTLIEFGCGSGNDTEVLASLCGRVVSLDMSTAVDSQSPETLARPNVLVLQADLRAPPLRHASFDVGYCHRVIQHTPDPRSAFGQMAPFVGPGGVFFLHSYDTHWKSMRHFKYWLRPRIRNWPHEKVFRWLSRLGPVLYPLVGLLNRIGVLRRPVKYLIPFENHDRILAKAGSTLSRAERYRYSLLITFDDLTPEHDHPHSPEALAEWFEACGLVVEATRRRPSIVVGRRPLEPGAEPVLPSPGARPRARTR